MSAALTAELRAAGLPDPEAATLAAEVARGQARLSPADCWSELTGTVLHPRLPFAVHQALHRQVFAGWDVVALGPPPAWIPSAEESARTHVAAWMRRRDCARFEDLHAWSVNQREAFWADAIADLAIRFAHPPDRVLDASGGPEHPRWLPGARLNIIESCFLADPGAPAIVAGGPDRATVTLSYGALQTEAARIAGALRAAGFSPGDALAIDMPMTEHAVAIYLGIVMAGMVVVSIADALAPDEVATRLRIAEARALFTAHTVVRGGKRLPLYEKILPANPPRTIVMGGDGAPLRAGDESWDAFLARVPADAPFTPVAGAPDTAINLLFSSGTTGDPKAIPWTHLTPIKAATDGRLHLDIHAGDVVAWPTNLGWMMGPWLIFASLLNRATIALFDDAPTTRGFGAFVAAARVNVLGLVPSIVKAWRADDRMVGLDWSALRCFGSTGEASNADDYLYLMMLAGYRPVIEYCGGTEIGGGYLTGTLVQSASPATFTTAALGSQFVLLDEDGLPASNGEVFLVPPTLGYSQRLANRDHHEVYFAGTPAGPHGELLRRHGDQIERLPGGFFRAHGRTDDTMNLGGIKVSSAEIERVLDGVAGVARTAAVAVSPAGGGPSLLVVYAVTHAGNTAGKTALQAEMQRAIKEKLNPLFRIADLVLVDALPVTASNKILRRELRRRYGTTGG